MTNLEITDKIKNYIYPIVTFISILIVWQFIVVSYNVPQYLMPSPTDIIEVFFTDNANLQMHAMVTLKELRLHLLLSCRRLRRSIKRRYHQISPGPHHHRAVRRR